MTDNILEKINWIKFKYKPLKEKSWEEYKRIKNDEEKEIISVFDFTGKFLCIDDTKYIYVNEQFEHRSCDNQPVILLRGQGFEYSITPYADETFMSWDQFFTYEFKICEIEYKIQKIKEITEEEYNDAFNKMLEKVKKEHQQYVIDYKNYEH